MITKEEYQKTLIRMWDSVRDDGCKEIPDCSGVRCDECPIASICCRNCNLLTMYDAIEVVEKWSKEHPIKTNRKVFTETLQEKFGDTFNIPKLMSRLEDTCLIYSGSCPDDCECGDCYQHNFWDKEYKEVSKDADNN